MDKQHIINEIKRTAEANHGEPLGVDRFYAETGIRKSDWYGQYWARWGDALIEAGYNPNKLVGAYEDEWIVENQQALDEGEQVIGYVYLMKSSRYYKIGRTGSLGRRESQLAIQLPEKIVTVHTIKTDDPVGIEAYWHK